MVVSEILEHDRCDPVSPELEATQAHHQARGAARRYGEGGVLSEASWEAGAHPRRVGRGGDAPADHSQAAVEEGTGAPIPKEGAAVIKAYVVRLCGACADGVPGHCSEPGCTMYWEPGMESSIRPWLSPYPTPEVKALQDILSLVSHERRRSAEMSTSGDPVRSVLEVLVPIFEKYGIKADDG